MTELCTTCGHGEADEPAVRRDFVRLAQGWQQVRCDDCRRYTLWISPDRVSMLAVGYVAERFGPFHPPCWGDAIGAREDCHQRAELLETYRRAYFAGMSEGMCEAEGDYLRDRAAATGEADRSEYELDQANKEILSLRQALNCVWEQRLGFGTHHPERAMESLWLAVRVAKSELERSRADYGPL